MKKIQDLLKHIAPTLSSAMGGPFAGVATKFITDKIAGDKIAEGLDPAAIIGDLLTDSKNLQKLKDIDQQFKLDMKKLNVDVFSLETDDRKSARELAKVNQKPQIYFSAIFLIAYFLMLGGIFVVEVSDSLNMQKGDNSLMGELQILFGVLTAGVGQILSFWFGGIMGRSRSS